MNTLPANFRPKFDAAESAFVERALLYVETETYNVLFPPMEGRKYVPTDNKTPMGAKHSPVYKQDTRTGYFARLVTEARGRTLLNVQICL